MKVVDKTVQKPETNNAYVLVDRSGSMFGEWTDTIGSVNTYIKGLPEDTNVTVVFFDTSEYVIARKGKASEIVALDPKEILPRGGTPLYDAMGKIMDGIFADAPDKAVLVIMTDGYENSSTEYKVADVKAKLLTLEEKKYALVYLGAAFKEVESYSQSTFGIKTSSSYSTSAQTRGVAMNLNAMKSTAYFGSGDVTDMEFTVGEKAQVSGE